MDYAKYKHIFSHHEGEVLEFYGGAPSTYFKLLKKAGFEVEDYSESICIEAAKEIDLDYYQRFSKLPQFQAFLAKKQVSLRRCEDV